MPPPVRGACVGSTTGRPPLPVYSATARQCAKPRTYGNGVDGGRDVVKFDMCESKGLTLDQVSEGGAAALKSYHGRYWKESGQFL